MQSATHEDFSRQEHAKASSDRSFGFVFAVVFAIFAVTPLLRGKPMRLWCFAVSGVFLIAALLVPAVLHPLNLLWTKLGHLISKVTNPIITAIMFYLLFTPVAFLLRVFGSDLLRLKRNAQESTYWIPRVPPGPAPDTLRNQF
jgi:hypothetical protein